MTDIRRIQALSWVVLLAVAPAAHALSFRWPLGNGDRNVQDEMAHDIEVGGVRYTGVDYGCVANQWTTGHRGLDVGSSGAPVYAAASGRVVHSAANYPNQPDPEADDGMGNHVALWHGDGYETLYQHLDGQSIPGEGRWVTCGEIIGYTGQSGSTEGYPHLHFEVRAEVPPAVYGDRSLYYRGRAVDPYHGTCSPSPSRWYQQNTSSPSTSCDPAQPQDMPPPGEPPPPAPTGDNAEFVSETIPDGEDVTQNSTIEKRWTIRNNGATTWTRADGYKLSFLRGTRMGGAQVLELGSTERVRPGQTREFKVRLTAAVEPGSYEGTWQMSRNTARFGDYFWYDIDVTGWGGKGCFSYTLMRNVTEGHCVQVLYPGCGLASCGWLRCLDGAWSCATRATCDAGATSRPSCSSGGGGGGGCECRSGVDNYCLYPARTSGCTMTAPGGYCDPDGDGSFADADWSRGYYEYQGSCGSSPPPPPPPTCTCRSGVDNYCLYPVDTAGCAMTAPGGYCDPNGDGSFSDADWNRGYGEYQASCGSPPPPPTCACRSGVDNFCLYPVNTAGCAMTAPGGYCDPDGDGSFTDGDWNRGYFEFQGACP